MQRAELVRLNCEVLGIFSRMLRFTNRKHRRAMKRQAGHTDDMTMVTEMGTAEENGTQQV